LDKSLECKDTYMFDNLHVAAFQGTPLERSIYGTDTSLNKLSEKDVATYMDRNYSAPQINLSAVGAVNKDIIEKSADKNFGSLSQIKILNEHNNIDFVGSEVRIRDDDIHGCHVIYGFKGASTRDENLNSHKIITELLGSYDDIYGGLNNNGSHLSEMLAQERQTYSYNHFNFNYRDNGIFGVKGFFTTHGEHDLDTSSDFILKEVQRIGKTISQNDFKRAQNNVISNTLFRWDDDATLATDLGRKAISHKKAFSLSHEVNEIKNLTTTDIKRVTKELDDTCPVIVSFGQTETMPDYMNLRQRTLWSLW